MRMAKITSVKPLTLALAVVVVVLLIVYVTRSSYVEYPFTHDTRPPGHETQRWTQRPFERQTQRPLRPGYSRPLNPRMTRAPSLWGGGNPGKPGKPTGIGGGGTVEPLHVQNQVRLSRPPR